MDKAYPKPFDRITVNPAKMGGEPCIRGLRITVRNVMTILASYPERAALFANYPDLEEEDLRQAQKFFVPHLLRRYGALSDAGSSAALRSGRNDKASTKQIPPPAAAE